MANENVGEEFIEKESPTNLTSTVPPHTQGQRRASEARLWSWKLLKLISSLSLRVVYISPNGHKLFFPTLFQLRQAVNNDFALEVAVE